MEEISIKKKILRSLLIVLILGGFFALVFLFLVQTGLWENVNSVEKAKNFILDFGFYGRLAFVVLQFLQVTFLPIPSTILTIAGALIYGPIQAMLLSLAGILLGSFFAWQNFWEKTCNLYGWKNNLRKMEKIIEQSEIFFFVYDVLSVFPR